MLDIVGAVSGLALLGLPMLAVALAIKLTSPGPVLFVQQREGLGGRAFKIFKFRSMRCEACDAEGLRQVSELDPRLTKLGRFLRKSNWDELPQLFNVLRGDMSLVGPRPHVTGMTAAGRPYKDLVDYYEQRFQMLPGMTGWAQANGLRGPTKDGAAAKARIDHDIAYIQNFSVWLDLKIILLTIFRESWSGRGD